MHLTEVRKMRVGDARILIIMLHLIPSFLIIKDVNHMVSFILSTLLILLNITLIRRRSKLEDPQY